MNYTVYNDATGEILELVSISNPDMISTILSNKVYVEGRYDSQLYYIDQAQPVEKPGRPLDGLDYDFDWTTKTWQLNLDKTSQRVRQLRDNELNQVDRVNPVWYATLTSEQQHELATYRLALLAVPQQSGFPVLVNWPAKPTWL